MIGAGSVVFKRKNNSAYIFFVKNAYGRWTFPKGKQEPNEALVNTAIREAFEEAGLKNLKYVATLGRTTFRFRKSGQGIQKTVNFFLFEVPPETEEKMTGVEGGMWEAKWVPMHQAILTNGYQNLDRLLAKAIRIIQNNGKPLYHVQNRYQPRRPHQPPKDAFKHRKPRVIF